MTPTTWWVIQGELGFLGDPGSDSSSPPAFLWTSAEEAWHFATLERAIKTVKELKETKAFAGMDLYVAPFKG